MYSYKNETHSVISWYPYTDAKILQKKVATRFYQAYSHTGKQLTEIFIFQNVDFPLRNAAQWLQFTYPISLLPLNQ